MASSRTDSQCKLVADLFPALNFPAADCCRRGDPMVVNCSSTGAITELRFERVPLGGTIPEGIAQLTFLERLEIEYAQLEGRIPDSIGTMANLWMLSVILSFSFFFQLCFIVDSNSSVQTRSFRSNNLSGPIPPSLGNLSNLKLLKLHENRLEGEIPASFENLKELYYL
ncbi:hypothetical protein HDU67_005403 [Dinochytrium kinnereticum]|nr:hypothetical protein HDU67_005403 [Dinochytrium kinnereticum]